MKKQLEKIRVLVVEPTKSPYSVMIDNNYDTFNKITGGNGIEYIDMPNSCHIYCNIEGKLNGLPRNRRLNKYDIICGTFLVCAHDRNDENINVSMSDQQISQYIELFYEPENFSEQNIDNVKYYDKNILTEWVRNFVNFVDEVKPIDENEMERY